MALGRHSKTKGWFGCDIAVSDSALSEKKDLIKFPRKLKAGN